MPPFEGTNAAWPLLSTSFAGFGYLPPFPRYGLIWGFHILMVFRISNLIVMGLYSLVLLFGGCGGVAVVRILDSDW